MFLKQHKKKYKLLYKKIIKLRTNPQNKKKILNFKKQKWLKFIEFDKKKEKWYNKYNPSNVNRYVVSEFTNKHLSYTKKYKNTHTAFKIFNYMYGILNKKAVKNNIKLISKNLKCYNKKFFELFEKRLDVILYRSKFCHSVRNAQQLIKHKKVFVNKELVTSKNCVLKNGDLIEINLKNKILIELNISKAAWWPIPPKHLIINYKTLQIILCKIEDTHFFSDINLEKILINFIKH